MNKELLRQKMLHLRRSESAAEHANIDARISEVILTHPSWANARSIAAYVSLSDEISTHQILKEAWAQSKIVYLPRLSHDQKGSMNFYKCSDFNELRKGRFGLMEPDGPEAIDHIPDLVFVPGLAFDFFGNRLGYGGGYYDRFLGQNQLWLPNCFGLTSRQQVLERLPAEEHDMQVCGIFTEEGLLWTSK